MKKVTNIIAWIAAMGGGFLPTDANAEVIWDFSQSTLSHLQNIKNSKEEWYKNLKWYLNSWENTVVLKVSNNTKIDNTYDINTNPDFIAGWWFEWYKIVLINEDWMNLFDELLKDKPNPSKIKQLSGNLIYGEVSIDGNISDKSTIIKSEVNQVADILSKDKISNEELTNVLDALTTQILGDNASEQQVDKLIADIQNTAPADIYIKFGIFGLLLFGLIAYLMKRRADGKSMFAIGKYGRINKLPIQNAETKLYNNHINENLLSDKNIWIIMSRDEYLKKLSEIIFWDEDFIQTSDDRIKPSWIIDFIKKTLREWKRKEKLEIITLLNDVYLDNKAPMNLEINSKNYKKISNFLTNNKDKIKKEIDNINSVVDDLGDLSHVKIKHRNDQLDFDLMIKTIKSRTNDKESNFIDMYIDILNSESCKMIYDHILWYGRKNIPNTVRDVIVNSNNNESIERLFASIKEIFDITKKGLVPDSNDSRKEEILIKKMKEKNQDVFFSYIISNYENIEADLPIYN